MRNIGEVTAGILPVSRFKLILWLSHLRSLRAYQLLEMFLLHDVHS